jgi:predicted RNA binding protein YcfA (HicA-like mRNA interferase family)
MIDAGFSVLQSQGSAITLRQDEERHEGVRTIVVHRPHPSPTINPVMLRSIAKRMTKWFGWRRELFIERGRAKEESVQNSEA